MCQLNSNMFLTLACLWKKKITPQTLHYKHGMEIKRAHHLGYKVASRMTLFWNSPFFYDVWMIKLDRNDFYIVKFIHLFWCNLNYMSPIKETSFLSKLSKNSIYLPISSSSTVYCPNQPKKTKNQRCLLHPPPQPSPAYSALVVDIFFGWTAAFYCDFRLFNTIVYQ